MAPFGIQTVATGDQGSSFSALPSLLQLGRELCSLCKHCVLRAAVFGDVVEGTALFLGGDLATSFLIREGIIRVVRQNTWNLDLFWPSVVHAHTFRLFPGLCRGEAVCPCERLLLSLSHRHCSFLVLLLSARLTSFPNKLKG